MCLKKISEKPEPVEKSNGFTLMEVLLSLAIIALLAGMSVPIYQSFQIRNDLNTTAGTVAQVWRRAGFLASASDDDSNWGVYINDNHIVLFKGQSFAGRDDNFSEIYDLPGGIKPTGLTELVFEKFTGRPTDTGSLTLTGRTGETRVIEINELGTVEY